MRSIAIVFLIHSVKILITVNRHCFLVGHVYNLSVHFNPTNTFTEKVAKCTNKFKLSARARRPLDTYPWENNQFWKIGNNV